ncbi:MAG TPA: hypothetical protein VMC08_04080 [Bacteroidales bacterium]|nr:hypothetical protein [Bacteroidales bacterium]
MIRKILAGFLVFLLLFNLSGYYFIFSYNRMLVRSQMRATIRSGESQDQEETLVIPVSEVRWIDQKEFSYRGKLYDVVSCSFSGNTVTIKCINDRKEESLYSRYQTYFTSSPTDQIPGKPNNTKAMLYHLIRHALLNDALSINVPYIILDGRPEGSSPDNCCVCRPPSPPPEPVC